MRPLFRFFARHEPKGSQVMHLKSGIGAIIGLTMVGAIAALTGYPMLIAPLGATAVLLFAQPGSPLAQPANVFGGYALAVVLAAIAILLWPEHHWWVATICVGVVIAAMLVFRVTHPPAGAVPLVAVAGPIAPGTLAGAVMAGATCLVAVAVLHHRLPPRISYPKPLD
ncbi:HPP family protein [Paradevosia shaoguanensis]|uniref:HPP family protein n=1 Tax=Paradevosia shaoguanensis TaxID=1335043 RepID=A0AA41UF53_9HYPH|nr:HPP family protein [Paradevosia shaoguanensis]MCF1744696.1 HPP family protein [Paradevosia shaoguanensis]MCI0129179.1 HPP family protein [Paradevosia shaoguanensis]CDP53480.1 CBS-domain-containing membrane protein [Devosia sp. DBB001]